MVKMVVQTTVISVFLPGQGTENCLGYVHTIWPCCFLKLMQGNYSICKLDIEELSALLDYPFVDIMEVQDLYMINNLF